MVAISCVAVGGTIQGAVEGAVATTVNLAIGSRCDSIAMGAVSIQSILLAIDSGRDGWASRVGVVHYWVECWGHNGGTIVGFSVMYFTRIRQRSPCSATLMRQKYLREIYQKEGEAAMIFNFPAAFRTSITWF